MRRTSRLPLLLLVGVWSAVVLGGALTGCQQHHFLTEADYQHYRDQALASTKPTVVEDDDPLEPNRTARPLAVRVSTATPRISAWIRCAFRKAAVISASGNRTVHSLRSSSLSPPRMYGAAAGSRWNAASALSLTPPQLALNHAAMGAAP